jgi:hypothetical protein
MEQQQIQNIAPLWRMYMPFPILPPIVPQQYCPPHSTQTTNEYINIGSGNQGGNPSPVTVTQVTTPTYTALPTDYFLCVDVAAPVTITLPTGILGTVYIVKDCDGDATTNIITVQGTDGQLIDGAATTLVNAPYGALQLIFTGTEWSIA